LKPLKSGDFTDTTEPFGLFETWLAEATKTEPNDPNAMALSTVDADGLPNVRMVLLKGFDARGFVFYTNTQSQKGGELLGQGKAAAVFHWKSLHRQVRVRGPIEQVSDAEADVYFESRARDSRIGAWASQQSRPLDSRDTLVRAVEDLTKTYEGGPVPRPPHWTGFRILPVYLEFWQDGAFRLHDRIVFRRASADTLWDKSRLYP
jgi:pyridoxamine 5'-phosphate oxidase